MDELDFDRLRAEIEAATMLPEFDRVARRARRVRVRGWLSTVFAVLVVLAMLTPAGVLAARNRDSGTTLGTVSNPDDPVPEQIGLQAPTPSPDPSPSLAPQATIVAADGADVDHVYALIDVCLAGSCNLQLSLIQAGSQVTGAGPDKVGLLRTRPTDFLTGFRLDALSDTSLVVSAVPANGPRRYQVVNLGGLPDGAPSSPVKVGDRVAVIDATGRLWAMSARSGQLRVLPSQPPVSQPDVESAAPGGGLWVTGTDPTTGVVAVSVSRDAGRQWTTAKLGVVAADNPPVLATYAPQTAYLLVRTTDRDFALFHTIDGGRTWHRLPAALPWSTATDNGVPYGLVVRSDGSLLAWLATSPTLTYSESTDGGQDFTNVTGPGGPVVAVPDGYVSLSMPPQLSANGSNWASAAVPTVMTTG